MASVYLAGAIDLIDPERARSWRGAAEAKLTRQGHRVFDPMSAFEDDLSKSPGWLFTRNQSVLRLADIVLAEHAFLVPHYGTTCEIEEALRRKIPVVVWHGELSVPVYLRRHEGQKRIRLTPSLDEAVRLVGGALR